ncbi:extensin family protein [Rhizobium terrae]|uniref:extensin family protein n=1 Tax=Rhizobium terrae TaxID=2171756 RepID=UPI0013C2C877|nr:extensin family protein [Rhizobium terrae]
MMKRALCLIAMSAPLLLGATPPPARPVPRAQPADVVEANFLTRLLDGSGGQKRSTAHRRASRPPQGRDATPQPPAVANVPIPLPKPAGPVPAGETAPLGQPHHEMARDDQANGDLAKDQGIAGGAAAEKPSGEKPAGTRAAQAERQQPHESPQPASKGGEDPKQDAQAPASRASDVQANPPAISEVPTPQRKPEENPAPGQPATAATDDGPKPDGKEKEEETAGTPPPPPPPPLVKEDPEELKACLAGLTALGAKFEPTDPIDDGDGCGIEHPIDVAEVLPGVELGGATMRCKTALTMAHWLKDTVQPALNIAMPGRRIVGLVPGSTYSCRLRNSASTGKISEHARGNAFDVAAFRLDNGEKMEMKPRTEDSTLEGAFQRTATAGACLHFTTVLSPGSDAAHETHLHLDVLERKGGYRYCR